jgi:hypothetical protein
MIYFQIFLKIRNMIFNYFSEKESVVLMCTKSLSVTCWSIFVIIALFARCTLSYLFVLFCLPILPPPYVCLCRQLFLPFSLAVEALHLSKKTDDYVLICSLCWLSYLFSLGREKWWFANGHVAHVNPVTVMYYVAEKHHCIYNLQSTKHRNWFSAI